MQLAFNADKLLVRIPSTGGTMWLQAFMFCTHAYSIGDGIVGVRLTASLCYFCPSILRRRSSL